VFFSSDGEGVTHVGIYIGNNNFVHASTSKTGVIVSSLTSSYYTRVYYGAKRVA
jgi:cell wall-associated NlpC family hydrolase